MSSSQHKSTIFAPVTEAVVRKLAFLTGGSLSEKPAPAEARTHPRRAVRPAPEFIAIAILNSKGGAGKSTTAIALAAAAHAAGEKAVVVDCDLQQHTARDWWSIRQGRPKVVPVSAERIEPALAEARRNDFTFVVIDTPGQDTPSATAVIGIADFVLVPVPPHWPDFRATLPLLKRLREARAPCAVLLTRVHKARVLRNEKFRRALAENAMVLDGVIPNRELFSDAAAAGWTIFDFKEESAKEVAHDVHKVYRELRAIGERLRHE